MSIDTANKNNTNSDNEFIVTICEYDTNEEYTTTTKNDNPKNNTTAQGRQSYNEFIISTGSSTTNSINRQQQHTTKTRMTTIESNTNIEIFKEDNNTIQFFFVKIQKYCIEYFYTIKQILYNLFLPVGYPTTVRVGYIQYQLYDSIQGLCSYLRGVLCTAAVLEAIGVGGNNKTNDVETTALSTAIIWAQKDGIGLCGGLVFTYYSSLFFDSHVKEFRLYADIINDIGFLLDMIAPLVNRRKYLFTITSCSMLCKVMCGISAGATKSSITAHFAIAGNMADLNAKESTQETAVNLLGMIIGIYTAKFIQSSTTTNNNNTNWILFWLFTIIHVYANYKGVISLRLRTINRSRADIIIQQSILQHFKELSSLSTTEKQQQSTNTTVLPIPTIVSPENVNESLVQSVLYIFTSKTIQRLRVQTNNSKSIVIHINVTQSLQSILHKINNNTTTTSTITKTNLIESYTTMFHNEKYILVPINNIIYCILLIGSTSMDEMKCYIHASLVQYSVENTTTRLLSHQQLQNNKLHDIMNKSIYDTYQYMQQQQYFVSNNSINNIMYRLEHAGWDITSTTSSTSTSTLNNNECTKENDTSTTGSSSISSNLMNTSNSNCHRVYLGFTRRRSMWTITTTTAQQQKQKEIHEVHDNSKKDQ